MEGIAADSEGPRQPEQREEGFPASEEAEKKGRTFYMRRSPEKVKLPFLTACNHLTAHRSRVSAATLSRAAVKFCLLSGIM